MFNFNTVGAGEEYYFDDIQLTDGTVDPGLSVESEEILDGFSVYPNPAASSWTITNNTNEEFSIFLSDVQGKLLTVVNGKNQENLFIDAIKFTSGIYFLEIHAKNQTRTIKLIKE
jgi:hypothetical protein